MKSSKGCSGRREGKGTNESGGHNHTVPSLDLAILSCTTAGRFNVPKVCVLTEGFVT